MVTLQACLRSSSPARADLHRIPYAIDVWCPVLRSTALGRGSPCGVTLLGKPIVLYRNERGQVVALEDRCPHRGVQLSLGRVVGDNLQCAYHGWEVDPNGAPSCGGQRIRCAAQPRPYAVSEAHGLIWVFLGGGDGIVPGSPPALPPARPGSSIDMLIDMPIRAHWSLILDNGMDLFHQHLHRDIPFIFKIHALENFGVGNGEFFARYLAEFPSNLGRRQKGIIDIRFRNNVATLRFGSDFVVYGIATPRSANGTDVTMWWLMRRTAHGLSGLVPRLLHLLLRRAILRAFEQDRVVLESEQRARDRGFTVKVETNPVIVALHAYIHEMAVQNIVRMRSAGGGVRESVPRSRLVERAKSGEIALIRIPDVVTPDELSEVLPHREKIWIQRYGHFAVLPDQA